MAHVNESWHIWMSHGTYGLDSLKPPQVILSRAKPSQSVAVSCSLSLRCIVLQSLNPLQCVAVSHSRAYRQSHNCMHVCFLLRTHSHTHAKITQKYISICIHTYMHTQQQQSQQQQRHAQQQAQLQVDTFVEWVMAHEWMSHGAYVWMSHGTRMNASSIDVYRKHKCIQSVRLDVFRIHICYESVAATKNQSKPKSQFGFVPQDSEKSVFLDW